MSKFEQKKLAKLIALGLVVGGFNFANVDSVHAATADEAFKEATEAKELATTNENRIFIMKGQVDAVKEKMDQIEENVADAVTDAETAANEAKAAADRIGDLKDQVDANKKGVEEAKKAADAAQSAADEAQAEAEKATKIGSIAENKADIALGQNKAQDAAIEKVQEQINENTAYVGNEAQKGEVTHIDASENLSQNVGDLDRAITDMDTKFSGEVSRLDSRIDKVDDKINKVGAMAAAIANLHTMGYDPEAPTEFAMSVGQYRDETGMAIGLFHYPNRDFMLSLSVSRAGEEYMGGIGATWKFGRKSPEKMLAEQKEKAAKEKLAKAEAMKEAARQARVEAQMARHAKMLAEREAAK